MNDIKIKATADIGNGSLTKTMTITAADLADCTTEEEKEDAISDIVRIWAYDNFEYGWEPVSPE